MNNQDQFEKATLNIKQDKFSEAIQCLNSIKHPSKESEFKICYLKAICYEKLQQYKEAVFYYLQVEKINPKHLPTLFNLGNIFLFEKKFSLSENKFKQCLDIDPNFYQALINLSGIYLNQKKYKLLLKLLDKNIYYYHELNINKLNALRLNKNFFEFIIFFRNIFKNFSKINAIQKSDFYNILGLFFRDKNNLKVAIKYFNRSIFFNKDNLLAKKNQNRSELVGRVFSDIKNNIKSKNSDIKIKSHFDINFLSKRKINIGFVSSDFREHAVTYQLYEFFLFFQSFYGENFNIHFFYNDNQEDKLTINLKKKITNWNNVCEKSNEELFNLIKKKQIDYLFDLNGLSTGNRMEVYENKPAKYLINWCGWLSSTYNSNFDFILGDKYVFDNFNQSMYKEDPLILKNIWSTISRSLIGNIPDKNKSHNEGTTFICPQSFYKISDEMLKLWKVLLDRKKTTKLILSNMCYADPYIKNKILKKFKNLDCDLSKVVFYSFQERHAYLELFKKADIALDTFPYSGGTTSFELSIMLIPIITLKGSHFISNSTFSINSNLGLKECIALNQEEYLNKAIELSENKILYNQVLSRLKELILNKEIFDTKTFTSDFYNLFKKTI